MRPRDAPCRPAARTGSRRRRPSAGAVASSLPPTGRRRGRRDRGAGRRPASRRAAAAAALLCCAGGQAQECGTGPALVGIDLSGCTFPVGDNGICSAGCNATYKNAGSPEIVSFLCTKGKFAPWSGQSLDCQEKQNCSTQPGGDGYLPSGPDCTPLLEDADCWMGCNSSYQPQHVKFRCPGGTLAGSLTCQPWPPPPPPMPPSVQPTEGPSGIPMASPSLSPSAGPTESPVTPPSAPPTVQPSSASDAPSQPPTAPSQSPVAPSQAPSGTPTGTPSGTPVSPSAGPSQSPVAPSGAPSQSPTASTHASGVPSAVPSASPSAPPTGAPLLSPSVSPSAQPSAAPAAVPSAAPSRSPLPPSASPSAAPSASPLPPERPSRSPSGSPSAPTRAPSAPGTPAPLPRPPDGTKCAPGQYRGPSGECAECSAEKVAGGCPPEGGGFPAPSADGSACACSCRFRWEEADCSRCPTGYGGLDCDRCAVGGAEPPLCAPPKCADPASLPEEVVTECGGGAREVALQPALRHKGIPAIVNISASSPVGAPQLSLPSHVPAQQLGRGGLRVEGAEVQLRAWLRLTIVPAETLTHRGMITVSVGVSGSGGCIPISVQFKLRCPAPAPRESGALPSAAVPERGEVTISCPLAALAHVDDPFRVISDPPGVVSYQPETENCLIRTAGLPSPAPEGGTTAVVTIEASGGEKVALPLHIEFNPPACGTRVRAPMYVQLSPSGKGYESVGTIPLDGLNGTFTGFGLIGSHKGIAVAQLGGSLRITTSNAAAEGTFYVRLFYSIPTTNCSEAQPVRTFWGPGIVGPPEHIRQPVALPFEHVLAARALASVGSPPWCPDPVLRLAQQPGGLELKPRGTEWVLSGAIRSAGAQLAYISATDCRGGSTTIRVELYGVDGTELGAVPATAYLEDTPMRLPFPRLLSTAENLTLSVAPQLDGQLGMGVLSADCPAAVIVAQERPALALQLSGPPRRLAECKLTLTPARNGCDNLDLLWRAPGAVLDQLLPGACSPDPPVATPRERLVRWGDYVEAHITTLVRSVDRDNCLENTTASNTSDPWLKHNGGVIAGYAPSEEGTQCQTVNTYTCQTNLAAESRFCATSLPDARMRLAPELIECVEDAPCWLHGNISIEPTALTRNDTPISLVFSSTPTVLRELRFNASPADAPEVRSSGHGEVRAEDRFARLFPYMTKARVVVAPDFDKVVNITVRGAVGTAVGEAGPLRIRFVPVNDAPRCNDSCDGITLSCGFVGGDEEDLSGHYRDVDDTEMHFGANESSFGVRLEGNMLLCTSFLALLTFYGIPLSGSAKVYARDPSGAVSPAITVEVVYELTGSETIAVVLFTIIFSLYGTFLLLFRPGAMAAMRNRRRLLRGGSRPGKMVCRIGREAAEHLRAAEIDEVEVFQAGWGLWWLCDDGGVTKLAERLPGGEIWVQDCGDNLVILAQPESAFDPGFPLFCAVVSIKRLSLGGAPKLSVLHESPEAELRLCLRLRHEGGKKAAIVWAAGIARCAAAALGSGPEMVEYTGTARQLTEFAHMQRVVGPAECESELVWTLHEGKSDRALLGGALPVGHAAEHEAAFCGGEEAVSPRAPGPGAAEPAGAAADSLTNPLLTAQQQQQDGQAGRPRTRPNSQRPATALELRQLEERLAERMEREMAEREQRIRAELRRETEQRLEGRAGQTEKPVPETKALHVNLQQQLRGGGRGVRTGRRGRAPASGGPFSPQLGPSAPNPRLLCGPPGALQLLSAPRAAQGGGGPLAATPAMPQLPPAPPRQPPGSASPPRPPSRGPSRSAISRTQQRGDGLLGPGGYNSE